MREWWRTVTVIATLAFAACGGPRSTVPDDPNTLDFTTHMGEHPGWIPGYQAVIRRYEERHPGKKILLRYQPLEGIQIWLETQFISGRGPDIVNSGDYLVLGARRGMLVPISEFLGTESPYAPGRPWKDTFYPVVWVGQEDPIYGELWVVPFNFFTMRTFYNKELFARAGIHRPPRDWEEFTEAHRRLAAAGIVPYLMANAINSAYAGDGLVRICEMIMQDRVPELDLVTRDGKVDAIEQNIAVYRGKVNLRDAQARESLRLLKEWSRYWVKGFNGLDRQQAKMLFANGMGAMYQDGSWETEGILEAARFPVGVFSSPVITRETTPFADGPRNDSNFNLWFAVSKVAERRGRLPLAVDFLQYLTGPEAADTLSKYVAFISALKDHPIPPSLAAFAPDTGHAWGFFPWGVAAQTGSLEAADRFQSLFQGFLADEITGDEMVTRFLPFYHALTLRELEYARTENKRRMEETGRQVAAMRARLDSLPPDAGERARLERRIAWLDESRAKARRQYVAIRDALARPPAWGTAPHVAGKTGAR